MESIYFSFGDFIVGIFSVFGLLFLVFSTLGFNPLALAFYLPLHKKMGWILVEIIYGFINPVIYLIAFQYSYDFPLMTSKTFNLLAWLSLSLYWGIRILFPFEKRNKYIRIVSFLIVALCITTLTIFSIKDIPQINDFRINVPFNYFMMIFYVIPYLILIGQLINLLSDRYWQYESRHFFFGGVRRLIYIPGLILTVVFLMALFRFGYSDQNIKDLILENKTSIIKAGKEYNVEPKLIASIIYTNHKYYRSIIKSKIEKPIMGLWWGDLKGHLGFSKSLNISIGLCQIKPVTVLAAFLIYQMSKNLDGSWSYSKAYRSIPDISFLEKNWKLKDLKDIQKFDSGWISPDKLLTELFNNEENIQWCAYILSLYIMQWEQRDEKYSIREKPEIVATLYSLGFEKSVPKENPKANQYGDQVMKIYESPWINSEFATQQNPSRQSFLKAKAKSLKSSLLLLSFFLCADLSFSGETKPQDLWYQVYFNDQVYASSHYQLEPSKDGSYILRQNLNAPGSKLSKTLEIQVDQNLNFIRLEKENITPGGLVHTTIEKQGKTCRIVTSRKGYQTEETIVLPERIIPFTAIYIWMARHLPQQKKFEIKAFSEDLTMPMTVRGEVVGESIQTMNGVQKKVYEVIIHIQEYQVANMKMWIDENGEVLQQQSLKYNSLSRRVEKEPVIPRQGGKSSATYISSNLCIPEIDKLFYLKILLKDPSLVTKDTFISNVQQSVAQNEEGIEVVVDHRKPLERISLSPESEKKYLSDSVFVELKDPQIRELAAEIVGEEKDVLKKATKLAGWISQNIKAEERLNEFFSARDVLKMKVGDCSENSTLFCALARSVGIPTRGVCGLALTISGDFGVHIWNEIYFDGQWYPVDVSFKEILKINAGHIKMFYTDFSCVDLALSQYQMAALYGLQKIQIEDLKGSPSIEVSFLDEWPAPTLKTYLEGVSPILTEESIKIENPIRLAILPFLADEGDARSKTVSKGLEKVIFRHLMCIQAFSVFERDWKDPKPKDNWKDLENLSRICEETGMDYLLIGHLSSTQKEFLIQTALYDHQKNLVTDLKEIQLDRAHILQFCKDIAFETARYFQLSLSKEEKERIEGFYQPGFKAFWAYSRGLEESEQYSRQYRQGYYKGYLYYMLSLKRDPNWSLAYKALGDLVEDDSEKAMFLYDRAILLDPYDAECYWDKYFVLIDDEEKDKETFEEATLLLRKALKVAPMFYRAHLSLGSRYARLGIYDVSTKETKKAIQISPKGAMARYNLGVDYKDHYETGDTRYDLGFGSKNPQEWAKAIECFEQALLYDPQYEDAWLNLGWAYCNHGEWDQALLAWQRGLTNIPRSAELRVVMCAALYKKGLLDQVESYAKEAIQLDSWAEKAHYNLGIVYRDRHDIKKAVQEFEKELRIYPTDHCTYARLGYIYSNQDGYKNYPKAIKYYKKAIKYGEDSGCVYNNLAWDSLVENQDISKTVGWAERGVQLHPEHKNHLGTLGWAYYKNGSYDKAIKSFEQSEYEKEAVDCFGLGLAYLKKQQKEKAEQLISKALRMSDKPSAEAERMIEREKAFVESSLGKTLVQLRQQPLDNTQTVAPSQKQ